MQVPDGWQVVRLGDVAHESLNATSRPTLLRMSGRTCYWCAKHVPVLGANGVVEYFDRQVFSRERRP